MLAYTVEPLRGPILDPGRFDALVIATSAVIARKLRIRLRPGGFAQAWIVFGATRCNCEVCVAAGKRHLYRYCDEFSFRWNLRRVTDGERTDAALRASEGKRLTYRKPIS